MHIGKIIFSSMIYGISFYPSWLETQVDIPNHAILDQARALQTDEDLLDDQWEFLEEVGVVTDEGSFVVGVDGVLTEEELHTTLKVNRDPHTSGTHCIKLLAEKKLW